MKILMSRIFWGGILILGGVLFLLENIGVFEGGGLFWGICFIIAGAIFLAYFIGNRKEWWALIPGGILLVIGVVILLSLFVPEVNGGFIGAIVLGGIGLNFIMVYMMNKNRWWALIPGGIMLTLAIVAALETYISGEVLGSIFLLGTGLTFAAIALIPNPTGKMTWAWIPSIILIAISAIAIITTSDYDYLWPIALILGGGIFIWQAIRSR